MTCVPRTDQWALVGTEHPFYAGRVLRRPLHDRNADGLCTQCGEPWPCPTDPATYDKIKLRDLGMLPRCRSCQTDGMWHPRHTWEPCRVPLPNSEACGCTAGVQPARAEG